MYIQFPERLLSCDILADKVNGEIQKRFNQENIELYAK